MHLNFSLLDRYPTGVLHQSKFGEILSPLARALDLVPSKNGGSAIVKPSRLLTASAVSRPIEHNRNDVKRNSF